MKTGNEKGKDMTAPGYREEKVYCRYEGEHSQRQSYLGECMVDMARLS